MKRQVLNAIEAGEGDLRVREWQRQIAARPEDLATRLELAAHFETSGAPELAVEHYRLALERRPDDAALILKLARLLRRMRLDAEAAATLETAAEKAASTSAIWSMLGILRDDLGDHGNAEAAHRRALTLEPSSAALHNNLGFNLLSQGTREAAIASFREALRLDASSAVARGNLAMALAAAGTPESLAEAKLHWESMAGPAFAHNNLAAALIEQGRHAEARSELAEALRHNVGMPEALENLKVVATLDGRPAEVPYAKPPSRWSRLASRLKRWVVVSEDVPARELARSRAAR